LSICSVHDSAFPSDGFSSSLSSSHEQRRVKSIETIKNRAVKVRNDNSFFMIFLLLSFGKLNGIIPSCVLPLLLYHFHGKISSAGKRKLQVKTKKSRNNGNSSALFPAPSELYVYLQRISPILCFSRQFSIMSCISSLHCPCLKNSARSTVSFIKSGTYIPQCAL